MAWRQKKSGAKFCLICVRRRNACYFRPRSLLRIDHADHRTIVAGPKRPHRLNQLLISYRCGGSPVSEGRFPAEIGGRDSKGAIRPSRGDGRAHHERAGQLRPREGHYGRPPPLPPQEGIGVVAGGGATGQEAAARRSLGQLMAASLRWGGGAGGVPGAHCGCFSRNGDPSQRGRGCPRPVAAFKGGRRVQGGRVRVGGGGWIGGIGRRNRSSQHRFGPNWNSGASFVSFGLYSKSRHGQLRPPKAMLEE